MKPSLLGRILTNGYLLLFFAYLFGPLAIMSVSAFNSSQFPRLAPWECFTTGWFAKLAADDRLLEGLGNSLIIGAGVVALATPIGLAAALWLSQVSARARAVYYTIFIAPILIPGVVLGISTLVFWDRLGAAVGAGYDSPFYNGLFLTVLGQVTFIAAYSMLVFLSRLQRFDNSLTEAALDLGATPAQAFRRILLPFLRPAIFSAVVLAFLASLENYNTTVFTIVYESTFTTVLAGKVRYGIDPTISAVAVVIIALTLIGALTHEAWASRDAASRIWKSPALRALCHPATIVLVIFGVVGGLVWLGSRHDSSVCEAEVLEQKRRLQEQSRPVQPDASGGAGVETPDANRPRAETGFGDVFNPNNLNDAGPDADAPAPDKPRANTGFGDVFNPGNLNQAGPNEAPAADAPRE